ncbi:hypothetical protein BTO20_31685 [Mycobacterium dioxanotrophicus]|jgi:hypothetical protein|uniref:CBU-0592-like domain-containing protein n=1 Tax=Mycobacterium dioxanotrophicus TaxID=482462 RepID=A0A1Y0CB88_9MYCO|nr:hypothetical protein [Mycobacterium dioxanotrophicus]ART72513.1 hypothetical protein BTO20_31685 [Mycobacterium dioxanotrophicus]
MYDVIQITGSLLILAAFVGTLTGKASVSSYPYLITNLVGSSFLVGTAVMSREWGFIILEGVWALVSLGTIMRKAAGRPVVALH